MIYNDTHTGNMSPLISSCSCLIALLAAHAHVDVTHESSSGIDRGFDNRDYTRSHIV